MSRHDEFFQLPRAGKTDLIARKTKTNKKKKRGHEKRCEVQNICSTAVRSTVGGAMYLRMCYSNKQAGGYSR